MKNPWLWIVTLVSVGVVGLAAPVADAKDCLDHLAGNEYVCAGTSGDGGDVVFILDFTASTGDSVEFTGSFVSLAGSVDLLCGCGYKGRATNPTFGTEKTVLCMAKPANNGGVLSSAVFAGEAPNVRQIKKAYWFNYATSAGGDFSGELSSAQCTR